MRKLSRDENEDGEPLQELAMRCHGTSILGDVQNLKGYDDEQPAPTAKLDLLWASDRTT